LVLPPSAPMSDFVGPTVALSPDGSRIVYVSSVATGSQLFSRRLDELEPAPLAGTQNARNPFFSPDGRSLAYFSGAKLYKLPLAGGPATLVADVPGLAFGATWGTTDTIVFRSDRGLMKVAAAGGEPRPLLPPDTSRGETYLFPQYLPDAKALPLLLRDLVIVDRAGSARVLPGEPQASGAPRLSPDGGRIAVEVDEPDFVNSDVGLYDMAQHTRTRLTFDQSGHRPIWTPDGRRVVYSRGQFSQGDLYWIPADGTGPAESLLVAPEDQWAGDVTP